MMTDLKNFPSERWFGLLKIWFLTHAFLKVEFGFSIAGGGLAS